MQNVQNATEIQQRVINLVELYRTKVGRDSDQVKEAITERNYLENLNIETAIKLHEEGMPARVIGFDITPEIPIEKQNKFRVNEQLLGHFYSKVAGDDADIRVLQELLPSYYNTTIFSDEEEWFLTNHFKEIVNYIIKTPALDFLNELGLRTLDMNDFHIREEILEFIKNRLDIPAGSVVYNPFTCLAQFPLLYNDSTFLCEESYVNYIKQRHEDIALLLWAWMKVAIYANKMDATVIEDGSIPSSYDYVISFIPFIPNAVIDGKYDNQSGIYDSNIVSKIIDSYNNLKQGGEMCVLIPSRVLQNVKSKSPLKKLWEQILSEGSIKEIIQLPLVIDNPSRDSFSIIIIEKGLKEPFATMIDARFAIQDKEVENIQDEPLKVFSNEVFSGMVHNGGKDTITGLRKLVCIDHSKLYADVLVPQVYVVERPSDDDSPIPLSKIVNVVTTKIRSVQTDLPLSTPWIKETNLPLMYQGEINLNSVEKADCPNNPHFEKGSDDYAFWENGKFIDNMWAQIGTNKGHRVYKYRNCTYIEGNSDVVLYKHTPNKGIRVALVHAMGFPFAVDNGIHVFCPKNGFDANSLAAILRLPIVYRQLQAFQEFEIENHLDDIFVPTDKRIIYDEIRRMKIGEDVVGDFEKKLTKKEKSLRMRKHALTQSLSSIKAMFVALNAYRKRKDGHLNDEDIISRIQGTTVQDAFEFINKGILEMMPALEHIADVEYTFAKAESFDPEEFIETYIAKEEKGWLNFKPVVTWKKGSNKAQTNIYNDEEGPVAIAKGQPLNTIEFPKDALEKILENIISNAKAYAFTDDTRKDYQLKFSWRANGDVLIIEIENNGTPIPEDRDSSSLLEYGVSSALHHDGHNGIGCYEIDSIMRRYKGTVEIVSTPKETFTVKYVLTFNNSNTYLPN